jgi:uncharacterized protein YutE (UPF0331/DUF86 family)
MTLPKSKHQILKDIVGDIINYVEFLENILEDYEDVESYKNASEEKKLATERVVSGLRQYMVNACREILDFEVDQKPGKRKESIKICMNKQYITDDKKYTEAFSFGEMTAKVYGRNVDDTKMYNGINGLPSTYRDFCQDVLEYIERKT